MANDIIFLNFRSIHFNVNAVRDLLELSARQTLMTVKAIYVRMGQHAKILLLIFAVTVSLDLGEGFARLTLMTVQSYLVTTVVHVLME